MNGSSLFFSSGMKGNADVLGRGGVEWKERFMDARLSGGWRLGVWGCVLVFALLAGCGQDKPTAKEEARQQWNATRANVLYGLAQQQYENGNLDESRKALEKALPMDAKNPKLHILMARLDIEQGKLESAERELNEARGLDPKDAEPDYLCGIIYERWDRMEQALAAYDAACRKQPGELSYLLARSEALVSLDRVPEAMKLLKDRMTYFENSPAIRDAVGQMLMQQGKYDEAVNILRQASILGADEPAIKEHLAVAMCCAKQYREAAPILERLLKNEKYAGRADLLSALGECHLQLGRLKEARDVFEMATQLEGAGVAAWLSLCKASLELGDVRRAELAVRRALSMEQQNAEVHLMLGTVRLKQDRLDDALTSFRRASLLDARDPVSLCMTGYVLEKKGQHAQAVRCYSQALRIKPDDPMATTLMAQVQLSE